MASGSLADQLEDAIDIMMSDRASAPPRADLAIGDLLELAAKLRLLPDPVFKSALKNELLGVYGPAPMSLRVDTRRQPTCQAQRQTGATAAHIQPTLFGGDNETYPDHHSNFAISAAIHAAVIVALATMGLLI